MKRVKRILCLAMAFLLCFLFNMSVFAQENNDIKIEGNIDQDIYEIVEAYKNGTFIEKNENARISTNQLFRSLGISEQNDEKVKYIYDNKKVDEDTYEATQIAFYSLEQENQETQDGVILFCRIVYDVKNFDNSNDYVMLTKVKGGVVQNNGNYWCEFLKMRYDVGGDAYDASGNRCGWKGKSTNYGTAVSSPTVGTTYSISGPSDYYYNLGVVGSHIAGFVQGTISFRLGNSTNLEVSSGKASLF